MIHYTLNIGGRLLDLGTPRVMGILNVTPDSFYNGGREFDEKGISSRLAVLIGEGADIIDIGGCSTRPGSEQVSPSEEMRRLRMGLDIVRRDYPDTVVSVDTYRADIVKMCVEEYGVQIVNDISGGIIDKDMFRTVATLGVPYILSHIQGTPQTMQNNTGYGNLMQDILTYFGSKVQMLRDLGQKDIILDPGFGFGKTTEQNYELLFHLDMLGILELPVLVGVSRKSMIYKPLGCTPEEALNGTTAIHSYCITRKLANIYRVHDVKACREAIQLLTGI